MVIFREARRSMFWGRVVEGGGGGGGGGGGRVALCRRWRQKFKEDGEEEKRRFQSESRSRKIIPQLSQLFPRPTQVSPRGHAHPTGGEVLSQRLGSALCHDLLEPRLHPVA